MRKRPVGGSRSDEICRCGVWRRDMKVEHPEARRGGRQEQRDADLVVPRLLSARKHPTVSPRARTPRSDMDGSDPESAHPETVGVGPRLSERLRRQGRGADGVLLAHA